MWTRRRLLAISVLLLMGCAPSYLNMTKDELGRIGPNGTFGVVFGSIQIKVEGKPYKRFLSRSLHGTKWRVSTQSINDVWEEHSIEVIAAGEKVPFVAKLPMGHYHFCNMQETEWEGGKEPVEGLFKGPYFNVLPGKPTYIGRLVLILPNYKSNPYLLGVGVAIEDAQKDDIELLKGEYGDTIANASIKLMVDRSDFKKTEYHEW